MRGIGVFGILIAVGPASAAPDGPRLVVQLGHSGDVTQAAATPDGKRLVTATADGEVVVWDRATGQELFRRGTYATRGPHVALSADGSAIAIGYFNGKILVHDLREKDSPEPPAPQVAPLIRRPKNEVLPPIQHLALSADGTKLISAFETAVCTTTTADGKSAVAVPHQIGNGFWHGDTSVLIDTHPAGKGASGLWDVATGKHRVALKNFPKLSTNVGDTALVLDGGRAVVAVEQPYSTRKQAGIVAGVWDGTTGERIGGLGTPKWQLDAIGTDGTAVALGESHLPAKGGAVTHALRVVSPAGKELAKPIPLDARPTHVGLIDGGKTAWASFGKRNPVAVATWDVATGAAGLTIRPAAQVVTDLTFSADGTRLVTGSDGRHARVWDLRTGRPDPRLDLEAGGDIEEIRGVTPAGLALIRADGLFVVRDLTKAKPDVTLPAGITLAALAPDGRTVAVVTDKGGELLGPDGKPRLPLDGLSRATGTIHFSDDGKRLLAAHKEMVKKKGKDNVSLWDVETGKRLSSFDIGLPMGHDRFDLVLSPDGNRLAAAGAVWDAVAGRQLPHVPFAPVAAFSPDGKRLWSATATDGTLSSVAVKTVKKEAKDIVKGEKTGTHPKSLKASPDDAKVPLVAFAGADGAIRFFDAKTEKEFCRLINFIDGSWAVVDPLGRFDASDGGDVPGLHWVIGGEAVGLDQLKDQYYDPGLLAKHLGLNPEPLLQPKSLEEAKLQPKVAVGKVEEGKAKLTLTDQGGGIGKVVVLVNGKEVKEIEDAGTGAKEATINIDLKGDKRVESGKRNRIEVVAYNKAGSVASRGAVREFDDAAAPAPALPTLWAVVCGVSEYANKDLNLRYSGKDADDFAAALQVGGNKLFDGRVNLKLLTASRPAADKPGRDNLLKALDGLKQAKPGDVVVVYLAGHGINHAGTKDESDYYFLTADSKTANLAAAVDRGMAVSSKKLVESLKAVPARKQVLILDTCASGKLVEKMDFSGSRGVPGAQVRALDKLKDRTGVFVLAGCASDAVSYEATTYGQGVLTYALLQGIRGLAVADDQVEVGRLFDFAADTVPRLAKDIGGVQRPVVAGRGAASRSPSGW